MIECGLRLSLKAAEALHALAPRLVSRVRITVLRTLTALVTLSPAQLTVRPHATGCGQRPWLRAAEVLHVRLVHRAGQAKTSVPQTLTVPVTLSHARWPVRRGTLGHGLRPHLRVAEVQPVNVHCPVSLGTVTALPTLIVRDHLRLARKLASCGARGCGSRAWPQVAAVPPVPEQ